MEDISEMVISIIHFSFGRLWKFELWFENVMMNFHYPESEFHIIWRLR